ncbi:MAG: hypothetical protein OK455_10760 [Thaumarchaeota archaeon]|nr:hypothetical protein [Nitrososphaerota archaeon]
MAKIFKRGRMAAIAAAPVLLLLLSGAQAFAEQNSQQINLGMTGSILNSGTQIYTNSGGDVVAASILGNQIALSGAKLDFDVNAIVIGIKASGSANIHLEASTTTSDGKTVPVKMEGSIKIQSMLSAEPFPLGCGQPGTVPAAPCTSVVPGFYLGTGTFTTSVGKSTQHVTLPVALESAFLNPFGAPIVLASSDGGAANPSILIITTYDKANIVWTGVQLGGSVSGTGSNSAKGSFLLTTSATENLMAGTEKEVGTWVFSQMTPSSLNAKGNFSGNSTLPAGGPGSDCSFLTGIPGTCTITGFHSTGQFTTRTDSNQALNGKYVTNWGSPAVVFSSSATATLGQQQGEGHEGD